MGQIVQKARVLLRARTAAEWTTLNEVLRNKELGIESDTGRDKLGDGVTPWNSLPYRNAGGAGGGGGLTAFVHNQPSVATTWTINHNLGYRPSVELYDSGSQEFDAMVSHPSVNQTVVGPMTVATSGFARLI